MEKLLNKLIEMMGVGAEEFQKLSRFTEYFDEGVVLVTLPLGKIEGGIYGNGLWGNAIIEDTDAQLTFTFGDVYGDGEYDFGEGTVVLNYADNSGLAYTSELEDVVAQRIKDLYGLGACGSEMGMQGEDYLSLDMWSELEATQAA